MTTSQPYPNQNPHQQPAGQPASSYPAGGQTPAPQENQKPGRFDNANWYARAAMALSIISIPLSNLASWTLPIAIICLFVGFGLAIYALVSKNAPKTERWCAWVAVGIFAFNIVAGIIAFFLGFTGAI